MSRPRLTAPKYRLVRREGRNKWYIAWTEDGKTELVSTRVDIDPHREEPSDEAVAALTHFIASRNAPPPQPKIRDLMKKRMEYWMGKRPRKKAAIARITSLHKMINEFYGDNQPHELTPERQQAYWVHRGMKLTAIARESEELQTAGNYAMKHPAWGVKSFPHIEMPGKRAPRNTTMTREEGLELVAAAKRPHVKLFILLAITTGRRHGAILDLTWDRVDWSTGVLTFDNPDDQISNKRRGSCQVGPDVLRPLREAWESEYRKTAYVVEYRGKRLESVKKGFAEAAIAAGLYKVRGKRKVPWVTAHVCKHSVISWMGESGKTVDEIGDYTDTDSATVKRVYKKVNPQANKGIKDELNALVSGIVGNGGFNNPKPARPNRRKKPLK